MRVFRSIDEARGATAGSALAIGNFDGVHKGHQALLGTAVSQAREAPAAALTFEPHPGKVLGPRVAPRLLTTLERKLELIEDCGVELCIVQPFNLDFAAIAADDFVDRLLLGTLGVRTVVVGEDFSFGKGRRGRVDQLRSLLARGGAELSIVPKVELEGLAVSSTRIRELVLEGRVEAAARLLGRPFDLEGQVVAGEGRGKTLGFPTANIVPAGELLPAQGVYAVEALCPAGRFPAAANLGRKPTFGEGAAQTLEVHLIGYSGGSLLGERLRVGFCSRLREELRFPSVEALRSQIGRDVAEAAKLLEGAGPRS